MRKRKAPFTGVFFSRRRFLGLSGFLATSLFLYPLRSFALAPFAFLKKRATQGGGGSGSPSGYSLRFDSASNKYLSRTFSADGNTKTMTLSAWIKVSRPSGSVLDFGLLSTGDACIIGVAGTGAYGAAVENKFVIRNSSAIKVYWPLKFKDISAWYHVVVSIDTTQAAAADRTKLYVNGVLQTIEGGSLAQDETLAINSAVLHYLSGVNGTSGYCSNGYLADFHFIDGQALAASSFGETNATTGQWVPKTFSGTYGTNGFYLSFSDATDTTATTLGKDASGGSKNWTPTNFNIYDQVIDYPAHNFPILSSHVYAIGSSSRDLSRGGLGHQATAGAYTDTVIPFALPTNKKIYFECLLTTFAGSGYNQRFGISSSLTAMDAGKCAYMDWGWDPTTGKVCYTDASKGRVYTTVAASAGQVGQIALDPSTGKVWFGVNNSWFGGGDPATGTSPTVTLAAGLEYFPLLGGYGSGISEVNFGQGGQAGLTYDSASGGRFKYTPPTGFKALSTANLDAPGIAKPEQYFATTLYTGTGASQDVTGLSFQPDLVWIKSRSNATDHCLYDSVRGPGKTLYSNLINAEGVEASSASLTGFMPSGFSLGTENAIAGSVNANGYTYAAWSWKKGASAGFDIQTATSDGTGALTYNHSLGSAPHLIISKARTSANWTIWHKAFTTSQYLQFNYNAIASSAGLWSAIDATQVSLAGMPANTAHVAYLWKEIPGFSKFGTYTGNGNGPGPFIFTGFRPAIVIVKAFSASTTSTLWTIWDTERNSYNPVLNELFPSHSFANIADSAGAELFSNGFRPMRNSEYANNVNWTYLYITFAEAPWKYALGR